MHVVSLADIHHRPPWVSPWVAYCDPMYLRLFASRAVRVHSNQIIDNADVQGNLKHLI